MKALEKRLAALEARPALTEKLFTSEWIDAVSRLTHVVSETLSSKSLPMRPSPCGKHNENVDQPDNVTYEQRLSEFHARMTAGALTADDHRLLASLPAADLAIACCTPEWVIGCCWRVDRVVIGEMHFDHLTEWFGVLQTTKGQTSTDC